MIAALMGSTTTPALAEPPPFRLTRYDEDYSYLAVSGAESTPGDRVKYIRLGPGSLGTGRYFGESARGLAAATGATPRPPRSADEGTR